MKHRSLAYCLFLFWLLANSCGSIPMTQEFKSNNQASKFDARDFRPELIRFLDYRAFKETELTASHNDSVIRAGIILTGRSIEESRLTKEVLFGKEADTCVIRYVLHTKYDHTGRSATQSVINLFSKKEHKQPQHDTYINLWHEITGVIKYPALEGEASFFLKNIRDIRNAYGHLVINKDTFMLNPQKGNSLQLSKGDVTYAIIQKTIMDKIYMYTKATAIEQMLIAAYFVVIERNWK